MASPTDTRLSSAFFTLEPTAPVVPLVLDSPHSGTDYPADFRHSAPLSLVRLAEDSYVDELYGDAPEFGATLLAARFPRAYLDANRDEGDIDPTMIDGSWPYRLNPGAKTSLGLGLVWKMVKDGSGGSLPLYDRLLSVEEVKSRIDRCYRPYHAELQRLIDHRHAEFGAVWHLDCHSMPSVGDAMSTDRGCERADFVLGDRDGTTCSAEFLGLVASTLRQMGYRVAVNDPYKGVELVRRYGRPHEARHSLQVEISRKLYLNEATLEKNAGFDPLRNNLNSLLRTLRDYVTDRSGR